MLASITRRFLAPPVPAEEFITTGLHPTCQYHLYWYHPQSHKVFQSGRVLRKAAGPSSLLKQGHPEPIVQHHVQAAFVYLQGQRIHNLPRKSLFTLTVKIVFLAVQRNLLSFSLCPLPPVLSLSTAEKSLMLWSLHSPLRY